MAKTYSKAPETVMQMVARAMKKHHAALAEAKVVVSALLVQNADLDAPALKLHGYDCAATIKVCSLKRRAQGVGDAELTIDAYTWSDLTAAEKAAVLDHELTHLQLVLDKQQKVKRDALGRPRLKTRLHDFEIGGFTEIVDRHGERALELQCFKEAHQMLLPFMEETKP